MSQTELTCETCGYEWDYSGEMEHATCPSCQRKTLVDDEGATDE